MHFKFIFISLSLALAHSQNSGSNEQDTRVPTQINPHHHRFSLYNPSLHPIEEDKSLTNFKSAKRKSDLGKLIDFFHNEDATELLRFAAQKENSMNGILIEAINIALYQGLDLVREILETHPLVGAYRLLSGWEDESQHPRIFLYLGSIAQQIKKPVSDEWLLRMAVIESYRFKHKKMRNLLLKHNYFNLKTDEIYHA